LGRWVFINPTVSAPFYYITLFIVCPAGIVTVIDCHFPATTLTDAVDKSTNAALTAWRARRTEQKEESERTKQLQLAWGMLKKKSSFLGERRA
jgi:hypothetical protein